MTNNQLRALELQEEKRHHGAQEVADMIGAIGTGLRGVGSFSTVIKGSKPGGKRYGKN